MRIFRKGLSVLLAALVVLSCWVWVDPSTAIVEAATDVLKDHYLFAYFTGTSKEGQTIHLAVSKDGYNYTALRNNEPVIIPSKGVGNVRDPYIWYNEQDNYYYILATDLDFTDGGGDYSNNSQSFIIWRSKDLVNWYDETFIDVSKMGHLIGDTRNMSAVWAPQVLWDGSAYVVYFTLACNATSWFDIVYLKTTDLLDPNAYYEFDYILGNGTGNGTDNGYGVIDADIIHNPGNGKYYLFYKTECNSHELGSTATGTSLKTIHYYVGDTPTGPFTNPGDTKWSKCGFSIFPNYNVSLEGCNSFFDNQGNLIMYADEFEHKNASGEAEAYFHIAKSNGYDFTSWSYPDVSQHNINSLSPRHGSVVKITEAEYNRLLNNSYNITSSSYPETETLEDHLVAKYFTTDDVKWNAVMGQPNLASATGITMKNDLGRGWYASFDSTNGGWAEVDFDSLFLKTNGLNYEDGFTITFSARLQPNASVNNENNDRIYEIADVFGSRTGTEHYTHFSPGGGGNGSYLGNYNGPVDGGNDWLNDINGANRDDERFHEYIISYATGNVMVYVDGQLVISRNRFTGVKLDDSWYKALGSNATMRIGRSGWDADPLFKGNIQNLCIYDCSMSYYDAQSMNDDYKENLGWVGENEYTGISSKVPTFNSYNTSDYGGILHSNILYSSALSGLPEGKGENANPDSGTNPAVVWEGVADCYFGVYYAETTVLLLDGQNPAIMPVMFGARKSSNVGDRYIYNVYPTDAYGSNADNTEINLRNGYYGSNANKNAWKGWANEPSPSTCVNTGNSTTVGAEKGMYGYWLELEDGNTQSARSVRYVVNGLKVDENNIDFGNNYYKKFNLSWQYYGGSSTTYTENDANLKGNKISDNDIYVIDFRPIINLRNEITETKYNEVMNNSALCPELREKYASAVYTIRTMDPNNYGFDTNEGAAVTGVKACAKAISEAIGTYEGVMAEIAREKAAGTFGHQPTNFEERAAKCTQNGLTGGSYCVLCGEILEEQQVIAPLPHTFGDIFAINGIQHKKCSVCGIELEYQPSEARYENLFSLNGWMDSLSYNNGLGISGGGTLSADAINGTITITNPNTGEIVTSTSGGANRDGTWDCYCIPVTGNKTYVLEFTTTGAQGEIHVFKYDINGNVTGSYGDTPLSGTNGTVSKEFTVNSTTAYIELRFDCNAQGTTTFSQIGVYEKESFDKFGKDTADARLGFYPSKEKDLCYPNPADGYTFGGWYTKSGMRVDNVYQLNNPTTIVYGKWIPAGFDLTYDSIFSFSSWAKSSCNQLWYGDVKESDGSVTRLVSDEGVFADAENGTITITNDADTNNFARTNYWIYSGNVHKMALEPNTEYILEYTATSDDGAKPSICLYITGGTAQYPETGAFTRYSTGTHYYRFDSGNNTNLTLRFDNIEHGTTVTYSNIAVYKADFEEAAKTIENREYRRYYPTSMGIGNVFEYTPTRPGYTFGTWMADLDMDGQYTDDNYDCKTLDDTALVQKNYHVFSTWTENSYTIKYNANGGEGSVADKTAKYTEPVTLPSTGFTRAGYTLVGWSTKADATTATYKAGQTISRLNGDANGTTTLYAIWQQNTPVNVTFDNMFDYSQFNIGTGSLKIDEKTDTGFTVTALNGNTDANTGFSYAIDVEPGKTYILSADTNFVPADGDAKGFDIYINTLNSSMSGEKSSTVDTSNGAHTEGDQYISLTGQKQSVTKPYIRFTAGSTTEYIKIRFDANNANSKLTVNNIRITEDTGVTVSPANKIVTSYTAYGELPTPTKVGYTFNGWKHDGTTVNADSIVNSTSTVYLKSDWSVNKYTINFNGNGSTGGSTTSQSMDYGTAANLNTNGFSKTGYTFNGWNTAANGSGTAYTDKQSVKNLTATANGTVTLYAQWKVNTYTVTYNANGGTCATANKTVTFDSTYGELAVPTRVGYAFDGWYTAASGGTQVTNDTKVTNASNHTIYAHWKANAYTVTYDANGGTVTSSTQAYVITDALNIQTPTRTGYTFNGWSVTSAGGNWTAGTTVDAGNMAAGKYGDVTLTAQWTENTYTIAFNANTGAGTMSSIANVGYDDSVTLTANTFTKTGYVFKEWNTAADGTGTSYKDNASVSKLSASNGATVTLYAQWTPITYQIQFSADDANTGSMSNQTLTYDKNETLKTNGFVKYGYTFNGWNTRVDGTGTAYANEESVKNLTTTADMVIVLYAQWIANDYVITLNPDGGSVATETMNYKASDTVKLPSPTKDGYTFTGWKVTTEDGSWKINVVVNSADLASQYGSPTLTAQWEANSYTIRFNSNTGTGTMADMTLTYDAAATALTKNAFTKVDYAFMGWSTSENGEVVYADGQNVGNLTTEAGKVINLYAVWDQPMVNITFDNLVDINSWSKDVVGGTIENVTDTGFAIESGASVGEATCSSEYFPVTANGTYVVDVDVKGSNWDVYVIFETSNGTTSTLFSSDETGVKETFNGITTYTAEITAPAGAVRAKLRVEANGANNAVRFENIRVYDKTNYTYLETVNKIVKYSDVFGELPVPVKAGSRFLGWKNADGEYVEATDKVLSATTIYLTSDWEENPMYVNEDTVVIEYGSPVKINLLANDKAEVTSVSAISTTTIADEHLGATTFTESQFADNELNFKHGSATLNGDGTVTYTPAKDTTNFSTEEVFFYEVIVDGNYYYAKVTVIPATTIYFEDTFFKFNDTEVVKNGTTYEYKWQTLGESVGEYFQSTDRPGAFNFADDANNAYGYDSAFDDKVAYSGGTAHFVEIDKIADAALPNAQFTFTGTGFDLFSVTDSQAGAVRVTIYRGPEVDSSKRVRGILTNAYFGYSYDGEKGEYVPAKNGALFQVPVVKLHDLSYDTYTVVVETRYNAVYDVLNTGKCGIYVDSVRIYDPMGTDNAVANEAYKADGEYAPKFLEIRDTLVTPKRDANGILTGSYDFTTLGNSVSVFLDGGKDTLEEYAKLGPKNEVYLDNGNSVSFHIVTDRPGLPSTIQLGMKLTGKGANTGTVSLLNADYSGWKQDITLNSTTERYYNIEAVVDWVEQDDGTYKTASPIIVTNTSDAIVSLTSLKWAFDSEDNTATVLKFFADEQTPVLAKAALKRIADENENNNPQQNILSKENISFAFSSESYTVGDEGTLTITTEQGVASVTVNGVEVTDATTNESGMLEWVYQFTADTAGYVNYEIVARDTAGAVSETIYATTFVEEALDDGSEGEGETDEPTNPDDDNTSGGVGSTIVGPENFAENLVKHIFALLFKIISALTGGAAA